MIRRHLAPGGTALLATKRFYFGVGGGTMEIENLCTQNEELTFEIVYSCEDGTSNIRDIIKLCRARDL